jgi:hypothetical protein
MWLHISSMELVIHNHYFIWQLLVGTSCQLVTLTQPIHLTAHRHSIVAARMDKWQFSDKIRILYMHACMCVCVCVCVCARARALTRLEGCQASTMCLAYPLYLLLKVNFVCDHLLLGRFPCPRFTVKMQKQNVLETGVLSVFRQKNKENTSSVWLKRTNYSKFLGLLNRG